MTGKIASESGLLTGLPTPRRYLAVASLSFGTAALVIDGAIANVTLPAIAAELGIPASSSVLIVTVYQMILLMCVLPFSALADLIGHRKLYQYGQLCFIAAASVSLFADNIFMLLTARAVQAVGAAAALSLTAATIRTIYPPEKLGRGLALNSLVLSIAATIAPTLGGYVVATLPWQSVFVVTVPLVILSVALGRFLPDPRPIGGSYDFRSAVRCAAMFGLVIGGLETVIHNGPVAVGVIVIAFGIAIGWGFVRQQLRVDRPILPVDLLTSPQFATAIVAATSVFLASTVMTISLPFRLHADYGLDAFEIGKAMLPWPLAMMAVSPISGLLSDKVSDGLLGTLGMVLALAGFMLLAFLPEQATILDISVRVALSGIGFALFLPPNSKLIVANAPASRMASAGGMITTTRLIGQTVGATLVAALLTFQLGNGPVPAIVAAGLALIALVCSAMQISHARADVANP
jgi:MFS transporter, DHA2 family, multidrug resistance protein